MAFLRTSRKDSRVARLTAGFSGVVWQHRDRRAGWLHIFE
jgi:hypothetical protein